MKIFIREAGKPPLYFILPTRLLLNRCTALITERAVTAAYRRHTEPDTPEIPETPRAPYVTAKQLNALFAELLRIKRIHGRLELVNVRAADGTKVLVTL
ncbi:hypothetical protein [Treponema brennaborense]|uniref:Uncharacterized protein n=1 Tax=Treponema brennaborense (strain DSM 12168 / CIP 105900 / DD5/3) TaxID=906968 RepID=F4LP03_TREBD|nr:hypothetical protein [Treponema brennaborense]AEE17980.1 hypothetical protein Trebr_2576 [Treponema brennaborense DSM 12168]